MENTNHELSNETQSRKGGVRERFYLIWDCYTKLFKIIFICGYLTILLLIITIASPFIHFKKLEKLTDIIWANTPVDF